MSIQEDWHEESAPSPGMSGTTKVLLILGGIGGFCALACCGGAVFLGFRARNAVSNDPTTIRQRTADIVDIEIPKNFEPQQSMDLTFMGSGMRMAIYQDKAAGDSNLILMEMSSGKFGNNQKQQQDAMQQALRDQGRQQHQQLKDAQMETRNFDIRGEKIPFQFAKGIGHDGKTEMHHITGSFPSKGGVGMLQLMIADKDYDDEVVKMIESIK